MRDLHMQFGSVTAAGTTAIFDTESSLAPFDTATKGYDPGLGLFGLWAHFLITTAFTGTNTPFGVAFHVDSDAEAAALTPASSTPHGCFIVPIALAVPGTHVQFPLGATTRVESIAGAAASAVVAEAMVGAYVRIISGPGAAAAAFSGGVAVGWLDYAPQANATLATVSGVTIGT